jgi:hypothetical protein
MKNNLFVASCFSQMAYSGRNAKDKDVFLDWMMGKLLALLLPVWHHVKAILFSL